MSKNNIIIEELFFKLSDECMVAFFGWRFIFRNALVDELFD